MTWTPENIKALREHAGWTLEDLGRELGYERYPAQRAHDLETGYRAPTGPVAKLLDYVAKKQRFKLEAVEK